MMQHDTIQELIVQLQAKGWTLAALADELGVGRRTITDWKAGRHKAAAARLVEAKLGSLMERRRIPKGKRSTPGRGQRNVKGPPLS